MIYHEITCIYRRIKWSLNQCVMLPEHLLAMAAAERHTLTRQEQGMLTRRGRGRERRGSGCKLRRAPAASPCRSRSQRHLRLRLRPDWIAASVAVLCPCGAPEKVLTW